jgi:hypothetical protein
MNKIIFIVGFILFSSRASSQNQLDRNLAVVSSELAEKLKTLDKTKVVVLYITDINKTQTNAGKYLADAVSVHMVNTPNFQVFDRDNLDAIVEAKKLIAEGYIDAPRARQLGQILSVNAIIIGTYTVLSNSIKLTLKALDASNGFVIGASVRNLPLDNDVGSLLGINVPSSNQSNRSLSNRGFNAPINSNEQFNNPTTVSGDCEVKKSGDYCFYNSTNHELTVTVNYNYIPSGWTFPNYTTRESKFTLKSGESKCVTDILSLRGRRPNHFEASFYDQSSSGFGLAVGTVIIAQGDLKVEQCKSKTYNIR